MTEKSHFQLPPQSNSAGDQSPAKPSTRRLLEDTKLSRLPTLAPRAPACVVCSGKLDAQNEFQQSTKICGDCLTRFAQVGAALDRHADRKTRAATLERWTNK